MIERLHPTPIRANAFLSGYRRTFPAAATLTDAQIWERIDILINKMVARPLAPTHPASRFRNVAPRVDATLQTAASATPIVPKKSWW